MPRNTATSCSHRPRTTPRVVRTSGRSGTVLVTVIFVPGGIVGIVEVRHVTGAGRVGRSGAHAAMPTAGAEQTVQVVVHDGKSVVHRPIGPRRPRPRDLTTQHRQLFDAAAPRSPLPWRH